MVRFHSEEDYLAAVHDAAYDRFLETAVRCRECGTRYDPVLPSGHAPRASLERARRVPQLRFNRDHGAMR